MKTRRLAAFVVALGVAGGGLLMSILPSSNAAAPVHLASGQCYGFQLGPLTPGQPAYVCD